MFVRKNILLYKLLAHFEVVATYQQLKKAADFLGLHPTNLSSEMRFLENFLSVKLLERKSHGFELTTKGIELHKKIQKITNEISQIPTLIYDKNPNQIITIALPNSIVTLFQKYSFPKLKALYPNTRFRILGTDNIQDKTLKNIDLCLTYNTDNFTNIDKLLSATIKFEAVINNNFINKIQFPITEEELINNYNICITSELENYYSNIEEKENLFNKITYILPNIEGQIELLQEDKTVSFIPKFLIKYFTTITKIDIENLNLSLPLYLISPKNRYKEPLVYMIYLNFISIFKEFLNEYAIEDLEIKTLPSPISIPQEIKIENK